LEQSSTAADRHQTPDEQALAAQLDCSAGVGVAAASRVGDERGFTRVSRRFGEVQRAPEAGAEQHSTPEAAPGTAEQSRASRAEQAA
jgi:hypothetical protein